MSGFDKNDFYQITNQSSGMRLPQSQPKVLSAVGRGRGRGKGREAEQEDVQPQMSEAQEVRPRHNPVFEHALASRNEGLRKHNTDPLATAVRQAQKPYKEYRTAEKESQKRRDAQKYIPGLTARPENLEPAPGLTDKSKTPKKVPPELIKAFLNGSKHPVSAIMEYSSMVRADTSFREACVERPTFVSKFACVCTVNGVEYPQGVGTTKKDAKTDAAKIAFTAILGIEEDDVDEDDANTHVYDSFGRCVTMDEKTIITEPLPPPASAQNLSQLPMEMLANPVSKLMEYCQKIHVPFTVTVHDGWDAHGKPEYTAAVIIHQKPIASGLGKNKKDAKKLACSQALVILQSGQMDFGEPGSEAGNHDSFAKMSHKFHQKLLKKSPNEFWGGKVMAAFILKLGEKDPGHVVAIGTGCCSIFAGKLALDGRSLIDCHAEVVARRSLLRYFHRKIKEHHEGNFAASIFTNIPGSFKLKLRDNISLHLYTSDASFGDAAAFLDEPSAELTEDEEEMIANGAHFPNFNDEFQGILSLKSEDEQMASPVVMSDNPSLTVEGVHAGQTITVMSPSDKILLWNILGLQGSLIGCYMEPAYLHSITIGQNFDHGHQVRAFCCRIDDNINELLPSSYHLNHPKIGTVANYEDSWRCPIVNTLSMNWMHGDSDNQIEVVDGKTGKSVLGSPFRTSATGASRLCKAGFLFRFRELAKVSKNRRLYDAKSYLDAKKMNESYQQGKAILLQHLKEANFGNWVKKPKEIEQFAK